MDKARLVYFENHASLIEVVRMGLPDISQGRHEVVGDAMTLAGSLAVLDQIARGELVANTVLLDGNLSNERSGEDARVIKNRIDELGLPVRTIGASGYPMQDLGVEVDVDLPKPKFTLPVLIEILDELEEPA